MNGIKQTLGKLTTGVFAFATAGYLVFAIMTDNGGSASSQKEWKSASAKSISLEAVEAASLPLSEKIRTIDETITGSISNVAEDEGEKVAPARVEEELTVLELIRKNADVTPGVSAGTSRVSVTVKAGDTLFGISLRHGLGVEELASLNGLQEPYTIKIGQTLYVAR